MGRTDFGDNASAISGSARHRIVGYISTLFLVIFAATHYLIEYRQAGSYSQPMTRLDALYFSTTMFTTVGFGDITPISNGPGS